jgi:hypothetical protein
MPLTELARELKLAILCITHLNKTDVKTIYRFSGSIAYTAVARAVFATAENPSEPAFMPRDKRSFVFVNVKPFGLPPPTLGFRIEQQPDSPDGTKAHVQAVRVAWSSNTIDLGPETMFGLPLADRPRPRRDKAAEFLRGFLAAGPRLQKEIIDAAVPLGFAEITLRRAGATFVEISREMGKKNPPYYWALASMENGNGANQKYRMSPDGLRLVIVNTPSGETKG